VELILFSHIVFKRLTIEANVLVNLLEFVGREVIVHCRRWSGRPGSIFDGLLAPKSWALDLVKRPPLIAQKQFSLHDYMNTLYHTLELLRAHDLNVSRTS
jgi:hypothetical protein